MNLVKRAVKSNSDLKLIVMSATIDTDLFSRYFDNAVVMDIPGFTYNVKAVSITLLIYLFFILII